MLIEKGCMLDVADSTGCTALHWAVLRADLDIVRALVIDRGDNLNVQNTAKQQTPLLLALYQLGRYQHTLLIPILINSFLSNTTRNL